MHSLRFVMLSLLTTQALAAPTNAEKKNPSAQAAGEKTTQTAGKDEAPKPTNAVVSTVSIEDIRDFDTYPRQVQSLVQSALALTRLRLGYLYGSHEPSKGGMDCSGTVYHTLHFQGLKDVPRQSDEMCQWVEKKTQLHLTPTATDFESTEFADLKPGDLLFWTNTIETKRKLPVTHVMIYLGKLKKTGKRIVFGASDGRSFQGERRSGVSVFDFNLPKAGSPSHFYGYGAAPGLLPKDATPVIASQPMAKQTPVSEKPAPQPTAKPPQPKEEVRKAVAVVSEAKPEPKATRTASESTVENKKTTAANTTRKPSSASIKPKTTVSKKKTTSASTPARHRAPPPRSNLERKVDQAVDSIRRFFRN